MSDGHVGLLSDELADHAVPSAGHILIHASNVGVLHLLVDSHLVRQCHKFCERASEAIFTLSGRRIRILKFEYFVR